MRIHLPLFLALICSVQCNAQTLSVIDRKLTFEKVFTYDSLKADQIFDKSKLWFIETFRNPKEVITAELKPSIIKGTFYSMYATGMGKTKQEFLNDIEIKTKDGALKITIRNIKQVSMGWGVEMVTVKGEGFKTNTVAVNAIQDIEAQCSELSEKLNQAIIKNLNDW